MNPINVGTPQKKLFNCYRCDILYTLILVVWSKSARMYIGKCVLDVEWKMEDFFYFD